MAPVNFFLFDLRINIFPVMFKGLFVRVCKSFDRNWQRFFAQVRLIPPAFSRLLGVPQAPCSFPTASGTYIPPLPGDEQQCQYRPGTPTAPSHAHGCRWRIRPGGRNRVIGHALEQHHHLRDIPPPFIVVCTVVSGSDGTSSTGVVAGSSFVVSNGGSNTIGQHLRRCGGTGRLSVWGNAAPGAVFHSLRETPTSIGKGWNAPFHARNHHASPVTAQ